MITVQDIRARATITPEDELVRVGPLVQAAITNFELRTGRLFAHRTGIKRRIILADWQRRHRMLYMDLSPITSLVIREWDFGTAKADAYTLVEDTDYELMGSAATAVRLTGTNSGFFTGFQRTGPEWFWGQNIEVTITGGVSAADAAAYSSNMHVIREALITQVLYWMNRLTPERIANVLLRTRSRGAGSSAGIESGDSQVSVPGMEIGDVHPLFENTIQQYRSRSHDYTWSEA